MKDQGTQYTCWTIIIVKNNQWLRKWHPEASAEPGHCQQLVAFPIETQIGGQKGKVAPSGDHCVSRFPWGPPTCASPPGRIICPAPPLSSPPEVSQLEVGRQEPHTEGCLRPFLALPGFLLLLPSPGLGLPSPCHLGAVLFFSHICFPPETSLLDM